MEHIEVTIQNDLLTRIERLENAHSRLFNTTKRKIEDLEKIVDKQKFEISYLKEIVVKIPDTDELIEFNKVCHKLLGIIEDRNQQINDLNKKVVELQEIVVPTTFGEKMVIGNVYVKKITGVYKVKEWKGEDGAQLYNYHITLQGYQEKYIATFKSNIDVVTGMDIKFTLDKNKVKTPEFRLKSPSII